MNKKRVPWIILGTILLLAIVVSGFALAQSSAQDILVQTLETMETINDAHAVVDVSLESVEKDTSGTMEVWARKGVDGPGAFRLQVLDSSEPDAAGAVFVSDGETIWAYKPNQSEVLVGTVEEAMQMMKEKYAGNFETYRGQHDAPEGEHPQNAEEAVAKLLEYFVVEKKASHLEAAGIESPQLLEMQPIPEQMPTEYAAVGGFINLWVDEARSLPFAIAYTGGSMGEFKATASNIEINQGLDDSLFTFDIPEGVQVLSFADLEPSSLTLEEARGAADFDLQTAAGLPAGATLVDILEVRGTIVQRYTLPDGGSFTIAQGSSSDETPTSDKAQPVEVNGLPGSLYTSPDGTQVLLSWSEAGVFYYVGGNLTREQAFTIAQSLH